MSETAVAPPSGLERVLWRVVLVLLLIGATLSIWAALGGTLGPLQWKLLASSFGVALYVALALACAAVLKRQPTSLGARAGVGVSAAGAALFVFGVWTNASAHVWWWKASARSARSRVPASTATRSCCAR
jgi:hypothetical protein